MCVRIIQNILALVLFVNNVNEYEWKKKKEKKREKQSEIINLSIKIVIKED